MSVRILLCAILCIFFCVYAWRNCFVSVCASIALMAIMQHPDVIADLKSIGGIQGLNLWNILLANVVFAWLLQRRYAGFEWDMPSLVQWLFAIYIAVILMAVGRMLIDPSGLIMASGGMVSEYLVNALKWILPGIILFDLCRHRRRVVTALIVIAGLYFLLALQVIKHVPLSYVKGGEFGGRAYKLVQNSVGYNRVTLSAMLSGASWAMLAFFGLAQTKKQKWMIIGAASAIALGQSLTGGRSGYISWGVVGTILCVTRWRRLLPIIPAAVMAICIFLPAVRDRMLMGMGIGGSAEDAHLATSGRNIAWPYVIAKIKEGPFIGFGREAMIRAGVCQQIMIATDNEDEFPHPHNAYLEILLDSGIVGFSGTIPFFLLILKRGFSLFLDKSDPIFCAAGGVAVALLLALLVAAMGGQTFYPREGAVGMWAAFGVLMRVYVERLRAWQNGQLLFNETDQEKSEDSLSEAEEIEEPEAWAAS